MLIDGVELVRNSRARRSLLRATSSIDPGGRRAVRNPGWRGILSCEYQVGPGPAL